jgi:thermostable 8-oxoguanine DNA glycosylase
MAFAAETQLGEGQFRRLNATLKKKLKTLKFRYGTRKPTVSKRVEQDSETLKTFVKKVHLRNTSENLRCVISSNLKHYHSCILCG